MEGTDKYRLPTEAEWEYAARAGTTSRYSFGDDAGRLGQYAWYGDESGSTHPVGQKQPNPWGLYDICGNVTEWVQDWMEEIYYARSPANDPPGPSGGRYRVHRGGSWADVANLMQSAARNGQVPEWNNHAIGFRLARSPGHP